MARTLNLFDLPQELLDTIFSLAYPQVPNLGLMSRSEWHARRQITDEQTWQIIPETGQYIPIPRLVHLKRTTPPHFHRKIDQWLVSKRFFLAAATAWIKNQRWTTPLVKFAISGHTYGATELFYEHATDFDLALDNDMHALAPHMGRFRNAKHVRFEIMMPYPFLQPAPWLHDGLFARTARPCHHIPMASRQLWNSELTEEELMAMLQRARLACFRGLRSYSIDSARVALGFSYSSGVTAESGFFRRRNMGRLEALARMIVFQPRRGEAAVS